MPPKKITPTTGKATPSAKKTTTSTGTGTAASTQPKAPIDRNSLITTQTSPVIVKKAFQKLIKLFKALADDMEEPLSPKIKAEILDQAGFQTLAARLSHSITKYVLFICQEGSITTIESQTQVLLNAIRSMTLSIRVRLKEAGLTLRISLAETGANILESLILLMQDLSTQVSIEWKKCLDVNGNFQSPLNSDGNQIVQITARVWSACEILSTMPLTDVAAITQQGNQYLAMIKDAGNEFKAIKEGEYEFPIEEEEEEEETEEANEADETENETKTTPHSDEKTTSSSLSPEESPPQLVDSADEVILPPDSTTSTELKLATHTTTSQEAQDALTHDFDQNIVAKSEFPWVQHAHSLITYTNNILTTFFSKILPQMHHPAMVGDVLNLQVPGSLNQQKQFITTLERRLGDIEKITFYIDVMCSELYSPQNVAKASKYAWFITSKISRLLTWCDMYFSQGWLKSVLDTPTGGIIFTTENEKTIQPAAQSFSINEYNKLFVHHTWWVDPLINPTLRPIVIAKNNPFISPTKICPQNNRLHEFDTITKDFKLQPISSWKWINFQRKELFELIYVKKYRDNNNLILTHFKLKSHTFALPQLDITDVNLIPASSGEMVLPSNIYTENDLFDDKDDVEPDEDEQEEDFDEDIDLYDDDFGFFSESD